VKNDDTYETLQDRLRRLQSELDETIRALDRVERSQPAAAEGPVEATGRRRPVREIVLECLEDLGWPAYAREISLYAAARYGRELPPARFGSLSADERAAFLGGSVRPVWLCHGLAYERGDGIRRLWARSDWPLENRVVTPTSGRVQHLKMTARLCEIAGQAEQEPGKLHYLTADHARDLPGVDVRRGSFDLAGWRDAALKLLAEAEPADEERRREAADRLRLRLKDSHLLFGAPDVVEGAVGDEERRRAAR
jgi:hypothetical protein